MKEEDEMNMKRKEDEKEVHISPLFFESISPVTI